MKTKHLAFLATLTFSATVATTQAQSVATNPVGYTTVTCLPNSDTIVSVPFLDTTDSISPTVSGTVSATGTSPDNTASFTMGGITGLTTNQYQNLYYVRFTAGTLDGNVYQIASNTDTTVTINLNGDSATDIADGDAFTIYKFWTLGSLFPQETQTTIVESLGTLAFQQRSTVMLPDTSSEGVNLAPSSIFFLTSTGWKSTTAGFPASDDQILWPDTYFVIRHPATVTESTNYVPTGTVDTQNKFIIPLATSTTGKQDNFVAITRPVDVKLSELNLFESGAFTASLGTLSFQRRDELMIYSNTSTGLNKAPTAIYFHDGTNWRLSDTGFPLANDAVIKTTEGFIIRKYQTNDGATSFWSNTPSY